jgi:type IV secretory pathway VirB10-like protein
MSLLSALPRTAVDGYLRVARVPADRAARMFGDGQEIAVERIDATLRAIAGRLLGDEVLMDDATARLAAVSERERALRLRTQAQETTAEADSELAGAAQDADALRAETASQAQRRREQAARERKEREQRAAKEERSRKQAARKDAARKQEAIEDRADRERLEVLAEKDKALARKEEALSAKAEAQRLQRAASTAKARRKSA